MVKQTALILFLLTCCFSPSFIRGEECVPPADYKLSAFVFDERYACKKVPNETIECGVWRTNCRDIDSGQVSACDRTRSIDVLYANLDNAAFFNPLQEARNEFNKNRSKRNKGWTHEIYKCPQKEAAMYVGYYLESAYIDVDLYHPNAYTSLYLDSKLPYNLPANDALITMTLQALKTYLCHGFDPKNFLDTLNAPPFSFPDRRTQQEKESEESTLANKPSALSAPTQFAPVAAPVAKKLTKPEPPVTKPAPAIKHVEKTSPAPKKETAQQKAPQKSPSADLQGPQASQAEVFRVADIAFYPANSPVPEVRHFQSANQQIDLKVYFKTEDKSAFQAKLKHTFAGMRFKETLCPNDNILLEFIVSTSYRAFLLHPSAIVSWEEPVYANALSDVPSENQKRQELCALNPTQFWN